jgi:hypothetical protein
LEHFGLLPKYFRSDILPKYFRSQRALSTWAVRIVCARIVSIEMPAFRRRRGVGRVERHLKNKNIDIYDKSQRNIWQTPKTSKISRARIRW